MGWTFMEKPVDVRRYFWEGLNWESDTADHRCLALSLKLNVCYAAIEIVNKDDGEKRVEAAVILLKYIRNPRDGLSFGHKDMSENSGPVQCDCPASILDMLSETDNEYALEWRARCRNNLKKKIPPFGSKVRFEQPIRFEDGAELQEFTVVRMGKRRKVLRGSNGFHYRLSRYLWRDREWSVVQ